MTTHRSLNKLEFKAHMSIHNMKDVEETEAHDLNATRDRFGKRHQLSESDGRSRLPARRRPGIARLRITALAALCGGLFCAFSSAEEFAPTQDALPTRSTLHRNTDVQVGTEGLDANSWLNQKFNQPEERLGVPVDENTTLGFNEEGEPNMAVAF